MKKVFFLQLIVILFLLNGCVSVTSNLSKIHPRTIDGYAVLYQKYLDSNETNNLLWNYETGSLSYFLSKYDQSVNHFDKAEWLIKEYEERVLAKNSLENIGSVLTNDNFMDYQPKEYEKIMVNTYKGIDFILLGDFINARIEFNRALVRQDRAREFFKKEIELKKKEIEAEQKHANNPFVGSIAKDNKTTDVILRRYSNLFTFKPYPDFVNPFTTYMAGLFFLNIGDYQKATDLLKESYGMIVESSKGSEYIAKDLKLAISQKRSLAPLKEHYTWVIFLNGRSTFKKQIRIDVPLFLFPHSNAYYTGIALPILVPGIKAYNTLFVSNAKQKKETKTIASMDNVIKTEFKKRFPLIMSRALTRTVVQTLIQVEAYRKLGAWEGVIASIYQSLVNQADLRMWNELPSEFQIVRLKTTKTLQIATKTKTFFSMQTDPKRNYIVFVTIQEQNNQPIIQYQRF